MNPTDDSKGMLPEWRHDSRFKKYVELFDERRFFEAHEVLEELWLEIRGEDREFLQGLIQIAVALEHQARGNPRGAHKVLRSAERRLIRYGEFYAGIEAGSLMRRVTEYLAGSRLEPPRFDAKRTATDTMDTDPGKDSP